MYFDTTTLTAGEYFNGVLLASNDTFYSISDNVTIINELRSNIGTAGYPSELEVLKVAKNVHKNKIRNQHDENLQTVFEYPVSSGNTFAINNTQIPFFTALKDNKDNFVYPYRYNGNDGVFITFANATEVQAFYDAAFLEYGTQTATRYNPALEAIESVTITTTLEDAIIAVFAVAY